MENSLSKNGYVIINFSNLDNLKKIQDIISRSIPNVTTEFHNRPITDEQRLNLVKKIRDEITQSGLVKKHLLANSEFLVQYLGPDIDVQSESYLRISRPNLESDFINWHRDTFYGNSYWELNFWLPLFPLQKDAGLMVVSGSHLMPANNVHSIEDKNEFRSKVTKGSLANELGYLYAPKSDDTINYLNPNDVKLLTPEFGQSVLFFTHVVHRAHNSSNQTRVSIDLRVKNMLAPTSTKTGYFEPLVRSPLAECVKKMLELNACEEDATV